MDTVPREITAKEARDSFSDLLGAVYYGKDTVVVKKQGRPFAVVINPDEYRRYQASKKAAKQRFFKVVEEIQTANKGKFFADVYKDVTETVEQVRKERYEKGE